MNINEINALRGEERKQALFTCCGSVAWVNRMERLFPVKDPDELFTRAEEQWRQCAEPDWREAFTHHPKIGDIASLEKKYAATAHWASGEQGSVYSAPREIIQELALANAAYEKKFGYIFIVCATGKSAGEMLQLLQERLTNTPEEEIHIAMKEQGKITLLRIQKLLL